MAQVYKVLRAVLLTLLILAVVVPFAIYITLSTPWAREQMRLTAQQELTRLLGTEVSIEDLSITPFNRLEIKGVCVNDDYKQRALDIENISARFELMHFIRTQRIVIDYVAIDGMDARIYKKTGTAPLNIAGIIDRLKSKDTTARQKKFHLAIETVQISNSSASYDVMDVPRTPERFNPSHISVSDLNVTAYLPCISDKKTDIDLQHLSFTESSGFMLRNLQTQVTYRPQAVEIGTISIILPESRLNIAALTLPTGKTSQFPLLQPGKRIKMAVADGSLITPSDFKAFVPALEAYNYPCDIRLGISASSADIHLDTFILRCNSFANPLSVQMQGDLSGIDGSQPLYVKGLDLSAYIPAQAITTALGMVPTDLAGKLRQYTSRAGDLKLKANLTGSRDNLAGTFDAKTGSGSIRADGNVSRTVSDSYNVDAVVHMADVDLGAYTGNSVLGPVSADIDVLATITKGNVSGETYIDVQKLMYKGNDFGGITFNVSGTPDKSYSLTLHADNRFGTIHLAANGSYSPATPGLIMGMEIRDIDLAALGIRKYDTYLLDADLKADLSGHLKNMFNATIDIDNFRLRDRQGERPGLDVDHLHLYADTYNLPNTLTIESDFLNGHLDGNVDIYSIGKECKDLLRSVMPALIAQPAAVGEAKTNAVGEDGGNKFSFEFRLASAEKLSQFFNLPVQIVYPVTIDGCMDYGAGTASTVIDAPYLQQGDKIIDNTAISVELNRDEGRAVTYATANIPTQKGPMALATSLTAAANRVDTRMNWHIERDKPIGGELMFSTLVGRTDDNSLTADINFNPGDISFGDESWSIAPSQISWKPENLSVKDFIMRSGNQAIHIDGTADTDPSSLLTIKLQNIQVVKIFETLDINKALIGGTATGECQLRNIFSKTPEMRCDRLDVKDISYNYCVLGDARLQAHWDNADKSVYLDADITGPEDRHSRIYGTITPAGEKLDITIDANHARLGFLKPFMSAFAADVDGYASGKAHLFGTFKYIDMEGDLFAESLGLKIDFTNTWYYAANDSVHIRPGTIDIKDIQVKDKYGNTATLNGYVRHTFFKEPVFDFRITDARNFLSYDVTPQQSPDWYGHIFGNGSANISGHPGVVNIDVDMSTAQGSKFTFVLSDAEQADDYTFITFRDPTKGLVADTIIETDPLPAVVREFRDRYLAKTADVPSAYNMDFHIDITPDADMVIVMDPVGGDEINATGRGNLRMTYASQGNDLKMYGTYTIEKGKYNFTLQDIIVKDFTIKDGSSITFTGDPYAAVLDIQAVYNVNANLSDLDESFLNDRDLNRTNVPVHALLMARGDMRQPEVSFDLEFPTLTSDIYRKVRSIISTEEMMNRQIIYLLALNRFYTPDYMSTTKGNELFSVASSTLSSQLSSMLGKLNNNLSIAPNLRSDRGDFSDIEVDLTLSGTLLDNRLRLNGNFGYRDRTVNTNQFIGDIDIEYLLNRKGTWRLKAYNRYNDQNYYLRTAQTTQGVGIMYKRDFDNMFNFLRPRRHKNLIPDSLKTIPGAQEASGAE